MAGTPKEPGPTSARVAAALRQIRQERGLGYAELSRRLAAIGHPILDTGLMKIEKGRRRVDVDDLMALSLALEVTPNRLLLPDASFANPAETVTLTEDGPKVRVSDAWAWAYGERPLGAKPASFADDEPAKAELKFIGQNRRYYARGGFGWLSSVGNWVEGVPPGSSRPVRDEVQGSGLIAGAILGAFVHYGLNTRQIRAAAESGVMAAIVADTGEEAERAFEEVMAWLMAQRGSEDEEG